MNRFKTEKFKLVAKRKLLQNDELEDDEDEEKGNNGNGGGNGNGGKKKLKALRLSEDMYEYVADVDEDAVGDYGDQEPEVGEEDAGEDPEGRNLLVFGTDTRYEIKYQSSATYWPQRLNGRTDIGCSGTIISTDAVLTAGHCVYKNGAWRDCDFAPAQYRNYWKKLVFRPALRF